MSKIVLDYNLNSKSTTFLNQRNQISASHKKTKQFYLSDDYQREDIEESDGTENKILLIVKTGY